MLRKTVCFVLLCGFATPAFAGDLRKEIPKAIAEAIQVAPRPAPRENPYKTGALVMVVGGGALAAYGFTHTTGAEVTTNSSATTFSAKETKSTGIGLVGLAVAAGGGVLYAMGEKKKASPQVSFGKGGLRVGGRVRW